MHGSALPPDIDDDGVAAATDLLVRQARLEALHLVALPRASDAAAARVLRALLVARGRARLSRLVLEGALAGPLDGGPAEGV
jgi:hypothetical protein